MEAAALLKFDAVGLIEQYYSAVRVRHIFYRNQLVYTVSKLVLMKYQSLQKRMKSPL